MTLKTSEKRSLPAEEMATYREEAKTAFAKLEEAVRLTPNDTPSWVRPNADAEYLQNRSEQCRYFDTHGFLVAKGFVDPTTIKKLKQQMADLADHDWNPSTGLDTFGTDPASNTKRGDYFLDSSNKVHYFAEPTALRDDASQQLKPEFEKDKLAALNKAGHGMHSIKGAFRDYTLSEKMRSFVTDLGWNDPVVPQSMYIFKQPKIGGTVHSHQDSTFLFTEPHQTCLGLWLALDDASLENGCLWVRPGSHREPLRRQFIRNPDYFAQQQVKETADTPKLMFRSHQSDPDMTWEGALPTSLSEKGFVPVEVKAGDLVTFCGTLDHLSLPNFSSRQRHTFQLHLVEGPKEGVTWSPENWLQYPTDASFVRLI